MDFKQFVDNFSIMTCIMSVEKFADGSYGNIRIVDGNKAYIDSIETQQGDLKMRNNKFVPDMPYEHYIPKDLNFEDACYRAAILRQPTHTYVRPDRYPFWFNLFFFPLESEKDNVGYCTYSMEISKETEANKLSDISHETAANVLSACIKLRGAGDFRETMADLIKDIRRICVANYSCILLMDFNKRCCSMLCEDKSDNMAETAIEDWLTDGFFEIAESWTDLISGSNCLIIKDAHDMQTVKESNPIWYDSLTQASVESLVLFPLKSRGELLGYIWATNFDTQNTPQIKRTLELTTYFLASEISSYQLLIRLKNMSSMDMLTGVYNRNEMNNRVDSFRTGKDTTKKGLGIVFADLNGLKTINDTKGHASGDLLLKNAANILQNVFVGHEIYRAGGDEFMVILRDTPETQIQELVRRLKEHSDANGQVSFAAGFCYDENCKNITKALKTADERMYEDKKAHYGHLARK